MKRGRKRKTEKQCDTALVLGVAGMAVTGIATLNNMTEERGLRDSGAIISYESSEAEALRHYTNFAGNVLLGSMAGAVAGVVVEGANAQALPVKPYRRKIHKRRTKDDEPTPPPQRPWEFGEVVPPYDRELLKTNPHGTQVLSCEREVYRLANITYDTHAASQTSKYGTVFLANRLRAQRMLVDSYLELGLAADGIVARVMADNFLDACLGRAAVVGPLRV